MNHSEVVGQAAEIVKRDFPDAWHEEFTGCISIPLCDGRILINFGTANETWGADIEALIWPNEAEPKYVTSLATAVSSESENPAEIAAAIVSAVKAGKRG